MQKILNKWIYTIVIIVVMFIFLGFVKFDLDNNHIQANDKIIKKADKLYFIKNSKIFVTEFTSESDLKCVAVERSYSNIVAISISCIDR